MDRKWLIEYRKKKGLKSIDVAKLSGISRSYYSSIENGVRKAPGDVALKISIVLDCPLELFYQELISDWMEQWDEKEVKELVHS